MAAANGLAFMQAVEAYGDRVAVTSQITHSSGQWIRQVASVRFLDSQSRTRSKILGRSQPISNDIKVSLCGPFAAMKILTLKITELQSD